jgi:nitrate reductase delta subunit
VIGTRSRRTPATEAQQRVALQAVGLLLGYPSEELRGLLPVVAAGAEALPAPAAQPLLRLTSWLETTPLAACQAAYVDTFDLRRRCCLYLSYYSHGDTRKRGMALLRFSHAYRARGAEFAAGELPDHLTVVCEFAATVDLAQGLRLLAENRAGIELLRTALAEAASPYLDAIDALRAVLPEPAPRDLEKALLLAQTGPPAEEVGLEPYGPPESMGGRR